MAVFALHGHRLELMLHFQLMRSNLYTFLFLSFFAPRNVLFQMALNVLKRSAMICIRELRVSTERKSHPRYVIWKS